MTWHLLHKNAFYPICLYITRGMAWSVCQVRVQLQPPPTCCKLLYAEVNGLLWINNTLTSFDLLRPKYCTLDSAISRVRGGTITSTRLVVDISAGHNSCCCARGDVSSCSRTINGLSRNLDTWPRGDTETWIHGYADNITHDHSHRAPGSWHNGLGLCRSLVTVQI